MVDTWRGAFVKAHSMNTTKSELLPWLVWLSWLEHRLVNQMKVRAHAQVVG